MSNPRLEDHLVGLELQLVELVESKQRAVVQGREADALKLDQEIDQIQAELAETAERLTDDEEEVTPKVRLSAPHAA
ncbi:MAG: hypothetical protein ACRD2W_09355 [Acidimicrobiales bacterium]